MINQLVNQRLETKNGFKDIYKEQLNQILKNRTLYTVYQPIVSVSDGSIFAYEGLTRGPVDSFLRSPIDLFTFAETEGYLFHLEKLSRELAIERSTGWINRKNKLFININAQVIHDPSFTPGYTSQILKKYHLSPENIVFEITERSAIKDFHAFKKLLNHYRKQGYEIAVDDAGAGYSSLQAITELEPEYIKIDRSLIKDIDKNQIKESLLEAFLLSAKKMNSKVIAEGIETAEELRILSELGVDYCQGFFLAKPAFPVPTISLEAQHQLNENLKKAVRMSLGIKKKFFHANTTMSEVMDYFSENKEVNEVYISKKNKIVAKLSRESGNTFNLKARILS